MTESLRIVVITVAAGGLACALSSGGVVRRGAACVNLSPGVRSIYRYQGKVHDDAEWLLVVKTSLDRAYELRRTVEELHPYDVPEIVALSPLEISPAYARWWGEQLKDADPTG